MFHTAPVEPATEPVPSSDLALLSVFALDFGGVPAEGWALFLGRKSVAIRPDSLGRDSIDHGDAKRLFDEKRANELRANRLRMEAEREAVEADQARRALLPKGVPWYDIPDGATPAGAMLATAKAEEPRRRSLVDDFWDRDVPNQIPQLGPMPSGDE